MAYLHCGRCSLEIKIQAAFLRLENCPRCLARAALVSPLVPAPSRRAAPPRAPSPQPAAPAAPRLSSP